MAPAMTPTDRSLKRLQTLVALAMLVGTVAGPAAGIITFRVTAEAKIAALETSLADHVQTVKTLAGERVELARTLARLEAQMVAMSQKLDRIENRIDNRFGIAK
jgi:uncharacterized coiled-coil protein SlyX